MAADSKTESILSETFKDDSDCKIKECKSIKRLKFVLSYYQFINDTNEKDDISKALNDYLLLNKYDNLVNDYHHTLSHLKDAKTQSENYQFLNETVSRSIKCSFENCSFYMRNSTDRETNQINQEKEKTDSVGIFYMHLLDNIHSYFLHSYDSGFRVKTNVKENKNESKSDDTKSNDDEFDENKHYLHDAEMENIQKFQKTQREKLIKARGLERITQNKFVTNMDVEKESESQTDEQKDDKKENNKVIEYSFGQRYHYWSWFKNNNNQDEYNPYYKYCDWYIAQKYENLKMEVLNKISIDNYNQSLTKAQVLLSQSYKLKKMKSKKFLMNHDHLHYGIGAYTPISDQNIFCLLLYTDYSKLCYHFSLTFRRIKKDETDSSIKSRNAEYWHFSKILRETVELFGESLYGQRMPPVLYHGISCMMYFTSFIARFCGPTSMTCQIAVASVFCGDNGMILEIGKSGNSCPMYFDCSIVSAFGSEDERLFFGGSKGVPYASGVVQFKNIRIVKTKQNLQYFIQSFTMFNVIMNGDPLDKNTISKKPNWHFKIIKVIINGKSQSDYIQGLYDKFRFDMKVIILNMGWFKERYGTACSKYFLNNDQVIPLFDKIMKLFPNTHTIRCKYNDTVHNQVTVQWISALAKMLKEINNLDNNQLKQIRISGLKQMDVINGNKKVINDENWEIEIAHSKSGEVDGIYNMDYLKIQIKMN